MDEQQRQEIARRLRTRGVNLPCPRCGETDFAVLDGFLNESLQEDFTVFEIHGQTLPTAVTVCSNCGFLAEHVLGILGRSDNS